MATRELRQALRQMHDVLGRCLEAELTDDVIAANALPALAAEYDAASGHVLSLASCLHAIASTHGL